MRRVVGPKLGVKASGGVKDQPTAIRMIEAGATRIGASAGVRIVHGNGAGPERAYGAEAARGHLRPRGLLRPPGLLRRRHPLDRHPRTAGDDPPADGEPRGRFAP